MQISIAPSGLTAIVKMKGKVESRDNVSAFTVMNELVLGEYDSILVDLSECGDMDSTFMGLLLLSYEKHTKEKGVFCLLNVGEKNMKLLDLLGIGKVIPVKKKHLEEGLEFAAIDLDVLQSKEDRVKIIEMAHRALAAANEQNAERFGSFLRLLDTERIERNSIE